MSKTDDEWEEMDLKFNEKDGYLAQLELERAMEKAERQAGLPPDFDGDPID